MELVIGPATIRVVRGSLLDQKVDVIVNAANTAMRGGGGIDGAIHAAAGLGLLEELQRVAPGGCRAGKVVVTTAHRLPYKAIIHTPGPYWRGGKNGEAEVLASCYRNALQVAADRGFQSIGFCSISTGIYGYPLDDAAKVAMDSITGALTEDGPIQEVVFAMFGANEFEVFSKEVASRRST